MAKRMIDLDPFNSSAYVTLGHCFHRGFKFDDAIKSFQTAVKIDPKNEDAYFNWGITLLHPAIMKVPEAIEKLKTAVSIDNTDLVAHLQIAMNSRKLRKYDDALHHYKHASNLNPIFKKEYSEVEKEYEEYKTKLINDAINKS